MKKFPVLFLIILLLVPYFVLSELNCRYGDLERYNVTEQLLVDSANNIKGQLPEFSDFVTEKNITSFIVHNPNPYKIIVYLNFTIVGLVDGGRSYGVSMGYPENYQVREICYENGVFKNCFINQSNITFFVSTPEMLNWDNLYPKNVSITKIRLITNKRCLNSSDCGTNICNGAGYCSNTTIIDCCPENTSNCNNRFCLKPSVKEFGATYSCEWECKSGVGRNGNCKLNDGRDSLCLKNSDCISNECNFAGYCGKFKGCLYEDEAICNNNFCSKPKILEVNKPYQCVWQCKTGFGKNGVCELTFEDRFWNFVKYLTVVIILHLLIQMIAQHVVIKNQKKDLLLLEKQKILSRKEVLDLEKSINTLENKKSKIEKEYEKKYFELSINFEENLQKNQKELDQAKGSQKEKFEIEINKLNAGFESQRNELEVEFNQKVKYLEEEITSKQQDIALKEEQLKESLKGIEKLNLEREAKTYTNEEGCQVFLNISGYEQFPFSRQNSKQRGEFFHKYWAKKEIFLPNKDFYGKHYQNLDFDKLTVHHIDNDKLNNNKENLIILDYETHGKIIHANIPKGNKEAGIKELKRIRSLGFKIVASHTSELKE